MNKHMLSAGSSGNRGQTGDDTNVFIQVGRFIRPSSLDSKQVGLNAGVQIE